MKKHTLLALLCVGALLASMPALAFERGALRERIKERVEQRNGDASSVGLESTGTDESGSNGALRERLKEKMAGRSGSRGETKEDGAEHISLGGMDVAIWRPQSRGAAPLIVFSHGFGGCNNQSSFLMQALAADGYLVAAPNHADNKCGKAPFGKPEEKFGDAAAWTDQTYKDRKRDMNSLIAALRSSRELSPSINWDQVGLVGHSLGGYTVLGLAGGWDSWKRSGFKAVLALSPYCQPYIDNGNLAKVRVPVMYQGGTRDFGITPSVKKPGGAYDQTPSPAYFVEFEGAGHFAWTDKKTEVHSQIDSYALAFFDTYVKGQRTSGLTQKLPGVSDLRVK